MPTVFYQDDDVVITDDVFAVWSPEPQVYDLESLADPRVEPGGRPTRFSMLVAGALSTVGAATAKAPPALPDEAASPPTAWVLRARYAGATVTLFESTNVISVIRVRRSLMRAFAANAASLDRLDRAGYAEEYRELNALL